MTRRQRRDALRILVSGLLLLAAFLCDFSGWLRFVSFVKRLIGLSKRLLEFFFELLVI